MRLSQAGQACRRSERLGGRCRWRGPQAWRRSVKWLVASQPLSTPPPPLRSVRSHRGGEPTASDLYHSQASNMRVKSRVEGVAREVQTDTFGEDGAADGGHDCAVCVEESEKREGWSLKGKSTPFLSALPASIRRAVPAGQHARRFGQARVPRELPRHLHLLSATPVGLFEGFKLG